MSDGLKSSEFFAVLGALGASIAKAATDSDPWVRLAAVIIAGLVVLGYLWSRTRVKEAGAP